MTDFVQSRLGAAKPEEHLPEVEPVLNRRSYLTPMKPKRKDEL